jgi:hypothetical protein
MGRARPACGLDLRPKHDPCIMLCGPRPTNRLDCVGLGPCLELWALDRPIRHSSNVEQRYDRDRSWHC